MLSDKKREETKNFRLQKSAYWIIEGMEVTERNFRNSSLLSVNVKGQLKTVRFKTGSKGKL